MIGVRRTMASVLVGVVLVATAIASMWLMASAGVFTGAEQPIPGAPERPVAAVEESTASTAALSAGFQAAQPRNPFDPLIDEGGDATTTTLDDESTTTTTAGDGDGSTTTTTTGDGSTTTTVAGSTTTTTIDDDPDSLRVVLAEVREENGALVAVVEVEGETYTVGVGDTFADSFKVVSLTETGGVFTFGDSAFTLAVGQSILK